MVERGESGDLKVDWTGEEQNVQKSGVGEVPESTDTVERQSLELGVHSMAVSMKSCVPVDREELHSTSGISFLWSLASKSVSPQHQLRHLSKVIHCMRGTCRALGCVS